jgi:hypothetical protein
MREAESQNVIAEFPGTGPEILLVGGWQPRSGEVRR